jgi:aminoglycoside phosphotransferase (APT) family kinase protein
MMTMPHAQRLVELAVMHAGAAGGSSRWRDETLEKMRLLSGQLAQSTEVRGLAAELGRVIEASDKAQFLDDGIVHSDFHHRNYLAVGDDVTGVFDWELASVGDWRADLVTLAFWSAIVTEQVPRDIAAYVTDEMKSRCPAEVIAFFAACRAITQLDFAARVHPDRVSGLTTSIEERIAPWWREPG